MWQKFQQMSRIILSSSLSGFIGAIAFAGGPLVVRNGVPVKYAATAPIAYKTDLGSLGAFSNSTATQMVVESFQTWEDVPTATIAFQHDGQLPVDVNGSNFTSYLHFDGVNRVIFDDDGSIVRAIFGTGAEDGILGFATSGYNQDGFYVSGYAVINGRFSLSPWNLSFLHFKSTVVHELGHFIGLDHSQINVRFANNGNEADDIYIPTMYPTSTDNDTALATLNPDDLAAVSSLYPSQQWGSITGGITGTVKRANGSVIRGANVLAISTTDSLMNIVSTVTDYLKLNTGNYALVGLGAGSYLVKIEPINPAFTGGSSVGPYAESSSDLSFIDPVVSEYYNGANESSDPTIDNPLDRAAINVAAGQTVSNINLIANGNPLTSVLEYFGTPKYLFPLPSYFYFQGVVYTDTKYAVRFTPGANATLKRVEVQLHQKKGSGSLKVTVHENTPGSVAGIPGALKSTSSMLVPFSALTTGSSFHQIDMASLNVPVEKDISFHVAFEVVGTDGDTLFFVGDDADGPAVGQGRSSSFFDPHDGKGARWLNLLDSDNYGVDYCLVIRAVLDLQVGVGREEIVLLPDVLTLHQNFPNPFNSSTRIRFELPHSDYTTLRVYDLLGRHVATLLDGWLEKGGHEMNFDAHNLSSGVYYYRIQSGASQQMGRMLLLR
jgi:hypothetical protein